jgi:methylenetetrahydrofolate dehydrogenase (NADP+)/methenyltetrahydrofolate cyclohydrolase
MIIIDGKKVAADIRAEVKEQVSELVAQGKKVPGLVTILVGNSPASLSYINSKSKGCIEVGMYSKVDRLPEDISEKELLSLVEAYNNDDKIHGILVQLPLPKHIDENKVIDAISPEKDVDGFHPVSLGNLVIGKDTFYPCTPAGIQELLKRYNIET